MGQVFGQVIFALGVLLFAVPGVWVVLRAGDRPWRPDDLTVQLTGRWLEARLLAVLIGVLSAGVVTAVWLTWPTG